MTPRERDGDVLVPPASIEAHVRFLAHSYLAPFIKPAQPGPALLQRLSEAPGWAWLAAVVTAVVSASAALAAAVVQKLHTPHA